MFPVYVFPKVSCRLTFVSYGILVHWVTCAVFGYLQCVRIYAVHFQANGFVLQQYYYLSITSIPAVK